MKICHVTSVHLPFDTRIFLKLLPSLNLRYGDVTIICAGKKGTFKWNGINIIDIGHSGNRLQRILRTTGKVYRKALEIDADIYHFHDPELIYTGIKLLRKGKKVIYDVHEDVPKDIRSKYYINKYLRNLVSNLFKLYEDFFSKRFSYIITATPKIKERFSLLNPNTDAINNYPMLGELKDESDWNKKKDEICYIGAITEIRGVGYLIDSLVHSKYRLNLAGTFVSAGLEKEYRAKEGWKKVNYFGQVNREKAKEILGISKAGVVTFLPEPNHIESQPNKIFEYMSAGIPVIGSDFELWKEIIVKNNCGICVNPVTINEIAEAIDSLVENNEKSQILGRNGIEAVKNKYNWKEEENKLYNIYDSLQ